MYTQLIKPEYHGGRQSAGVGRRERSVEWQTERCVPGERGRRERERGRASEGETKRGKRAPADARETRTNDFVLWAAKVICSLDMQSQWFSSRARTRVIPGRASSILLPSPRDFEISFAPSLEGEFSPLKREGERNPLPIDRYFATMPRHGSPLPSLPPLSFACRYYERKQTGNWFDRRLFFFFFLSAGKKPLAHFFPQRRLLRRLCRAMWKEIANAKLRFPPRWNPCRRWRAGYRRGTRIKNPIQRIRFRDVFETRVARGAYTSPRSFLTRFSDLILRPPVSPPPMYIVLLILGNHCHFARSVIFIPVLVFSRRFSRGLRH